MDELKKRLDRYSRLLENSDFKETIKDMNEAFNLDGSVIPICNCPNASEYLFAREGMRTYQNKLLGLVEETKKAIEQQENNDE